MCVFDFDTVLCLVCGWDTVLDSVCDDSAGGEYSTSTAVLSGSASGALAGGGNSTLAAVLSGSAVGALAGGGNSTLAAVLSLEQSVSIKSAGLEASG